MSNPYADKPAIAEHDLGVVEDIRAMVADFTAGLAPFAKSFEVTDGNRAVLDLIGMIDDACAETVGAVAIQCECAIADAAVAEEEA